MEAERDKKQAWQSTSASAETAKAAIMRAEAAVKEASDLRLLRTNAGGQHIKRTDAKLGFDVEVAQSDKKHGQSLKDVVLAAAGADGGYGGLEKTGRSWGPTEASLLQSAPPAEQYGNRCRTRYLGPYTESSADRSVAPPIEAIPRVQSKLGRSSTSDSGEEFSIKSDGAPRVLPPQATITATECRTPHTIPRTLFFDEGGSDNTWCKEDEGMPSPLKETKEPATNRSPGSGRQMRAAVETPPPAARATGREQCYDRHDSEGVKGALTGANLAWTDAPSSFGRGASTGVAGSRSSGGGDAGGEELTRNAHTVGREAGDGCRLDEEAHCRNKECRGHAKVSSTGVDGRAIDEVGPRAEGDGTSAAGESSPMSRGWKLQKASPHCPAAGHRRGRDMMSSRRSSLSGAGVGVSAGVAGEENETSPFRAEGEIEDRKVFLNVGGAIDTHHGAGDGRFGGQQRTGDGAQEYGKPPSADIPVFSAADNRTSADRTRRATSGGMGAPEPEQRRKSTEGVQPATASVRSKQRAKSLSLLGNIDPPCDSGTTEEISRRERRAPAPFATDAAEDELRPVREVARQLMLLQMETSQVGFGELVLSLQCVGVHPYEYQGCIRRED